MDGRTSRSATKAAFLVALKEQARRDGWARGVYEPEARTYAARRYDDGVLCRRLDELKPGDRVQYVQGSTGQVIEGEIAEVATMPEHHAEAGKLAYRLRLDKEAAERVGLPVTIPHGRVVLIWPESAVPAHPAEAGAKPGDATLTLPAAEPVEVRPAATVFGCNLREKARENRRRVKVGDRVTVTAEIAPPERRGVAVE